MSDQNSTPGGAPAAPAAPAAGAPVTGERHVSEVAGRSPVLNRKVGVGLMVLAGFMAIGVVLLTSERPNLQTEPQNQLAVRPTVRFEPAPAPPAPPPVVAAPPLPTGAPPPLPPELAAFAGPPVQAPAARPQPRLLVFNTSGRQQGTVQGSPGPSEAGMGVGAAPVGVMPVAAGGQAEGNALAARLQSTPLTGVAANVLRNQPYLLTMGTVIPCVLQTAMDSTLPGFVTCVIPQDVIGRTGLTLFDRGTRVVGQFQGGVRQGVERLFVVWTRAETPQGVVVHLDSPATDALGRAGLDGEVDRRFWQRFGTALLFTVVQGGLQAGTAAVSRQGTITVNTGALGGVTADIVGQSINIPPTIRKNQGELVSIFVARDLDFSTVYRVGPASTGLTPVAGVR